MIQYVVAYAATSIAFLAIDFVWLNFAAANIYRPRIGALLMDSPNLTIAGAFYLLYSGAVVVLAVVPAVNQSSLLMAIAFGAVLGATAYGTYDITNLATLRGWSVTVTIVDILWGIFLTGTAAAIGYLAVDLFARDG